MRAGRWAGCGLAVAAIAAVLALPTPAEAIPGVAFKVVSCDPEGEEDAKVKVVNNSLDTIEGQVNPEYDGGFEDVEHPLGNVNLAPGSSKVISAPPDVVRVVLRLDVPDDAAWRYVRDHVSGRCATPPAGTINVRGERVTEGVDGTSQLLQFRVFLARQVANHDLEIGYKTIDGSAHAPGDYKAKTGTVTIDEGTNEAFVRVKVFGDDLDEHEEEFLLKLTSSPKQINIHKARGVIESDDDSCPPPCHVN